MRTLFVFIALFTAHVQAQEISSHDDKYEGFECRIYGNDHRPYMELFQVRKMGGVLRAFYTPKFYTDTEQSDVRVLPGKFLAQWVPQEDPRLVELRNATPGTHNGQQGMFLDVLETREVSVREASCCSANVSVTNTFEIKVRRFFKVEGQEYREIKEDGLELSYHPEFCKAF